MTRQMFSRLHLTSSGDSLHQSQKFYFTIVLSQYCFNNTADLILLIYSCSPISRVTITEAVVIQLVLLIMSSVLLETCWGV